MSRVTLEDLREQLNWYSGSVSSAVRTTSFGVIAAIWAIFTADGISLNANGLFDVPSYIYVRLTFVFAAAALFADILQYVTSYWMTSIGYDNYENTLAENKDAEFYYDDENLGLLGLALYKLGFLLFPAKLILSILSALIFFILAFGITINT